jgi:hypothetical protein
MNLDTSTAQSSTRTLLSNVTACQVLANIAAMQFYYGLDGYAYSLYRQYIWQDEVTNPVWTSSSNRYGCHLTRFVVAFDKLLA